MRMPGSSRKIERKRRMEMKVIPSLCIGKSFNFFLIVLSQLIDAKQKSVTMTGRKMFFNLE